MAAESLLTGANIFALFIATCKNIANVSSSVGNVNIGQAREPRHWTNEHHGLTYVTEEDDTTRSIVN